MFRGPAWASQGGQFRQQELFLKKQRELSQELETLKNEMSSLLNPETVTYRADQDTQRVASLARVLSGFDHQLHQAVARDSAEMVLVQDG